MGITLPWYVPGGGIVQQEPVYTGGGITGMSWVTTSLPAILRTVGQGLAGYGVGQTLEELLGAPGGDQTPALPSGYYSGDPWMTANQALPGGATEGSGNGGGQISAAQACAMPFRPSRCGTGMRAVAQVHALVNPISGKAQWFGPGRIKFIPNKQSGGRRRCRPR